MKYLIICILLSFNYNCFAQKPNLLLAKHYQTNILLDDYWVSEKLDGVRAYWNGEHLVSRQGHKFNAPNWFVASLPKIAIDGELWIGRNQFDKVSGLVRRKSDNSSSWKDIKYMIFDLPKSIETFDLRLKQMQEITQLVNADHFKAIKQFKVESHKQLQELLDNMVDEGAEGLMLHLGSSYYKSGRSNDLLKLKKHFDAEATVIKHLNGKGKYKNMLGALLVETKEGMRFKIGTGFSDKVRMNPPPLGSVITYKYFGLTSKDKPRFASYMRIRMVDK